VVFHALSKDHIRQIVELMLSQVEERLKDKEIKLEATEAAKEFLGEKGYDPTFGARPLRRVIQDMVEDPLSEGVLEGRFQAGDTVQIDYEEGQIKFRTLTLATKLSF
jgi:ATP-dependent Clp protease ATP-binding subunit ClpC